MSKARARRPLLSAMALGLLSVALAACGSSTSPKSTASANSSNGTTTSDIVLGTIGQSSGVNDQPFFGGGLTLKAWADAENAKGGIDGHQIRVITYDDGGNASTALSDAKLLVADHVDAIVGQEDPDASTWAKLVDNAGIPVVGGNTADSLFGSDPNFYPVGSTTLGTFVAYVKQSGLQNVKGGVVYCTEAPVCAATVTPLRQALTQEHGTLVSSLPIAVTSPTFTAQCLSLKSSGAQLVFIAGPSETTFSVAQDCANQHYNPYFMDNATTVTQGAIEQLSGLSGVKMLYGSGDIPFFVTSTPATKAFHDALQKYEPSILNPTTFTQNDMTTWASGQLVAAAIKASGSFTPSGIKNGLYELHGVTLGNLTPPLSFKRGAATTVMCAFSFAGTTSGFANPTLKAEYC